MDGLIDARDGRVTASALRTPTPASTGPGHPHLRPASGPPLVLMGYSGGALAALLLAQRSPQLPQALVVSAPPARPLMRQRSITVSHSPHGSAIPIRIHPVCA